MGDSLLERVKRFRAIRFNDGKLYLWNIPGILTPLSMNSYLWRLLEKRLGHREAMSILYDIGKIQGKHASNIIIEKYGFRKKSISEKKRVLNLITSQSEVIGHGKFKWVKYDFKKNIFIITGYSNMAEDYKNSFDLQKYPIDHFLRGIITSILETVIKKKFLTIETTCVVSGNRNCTFVIKPLEKWNENDSLVNSQFPCEVFSIETLGLKKEPFKRV